MPLCIFSVKVQRRLHLQYFFVCISEYISLPCTYWICTNLHCKSLALPCKWHATIGPEQLSFKFWEDQKSDAPSWNTIGLRHTTLSFKYCETSIQHPRTSLLAWQNLLSKHFFHSYDILSKPQLRKKKWWFHRDNAMLLPSIPLTCSLLVLDAVERSAMALPRLSCKWSRQSSTNDANTSF